MLPMLIRIRIKDREHGKSLALFFPMIIIYLLLIVVYLLLALVYAVLLVVPGKTSEARAAIGLSFSLPNLLIAARGTEVTIHSDGSDVMIRIH